MAELDENYLAHHGIKGQKWGVRRFQNPDGTRTPEGKARYGYKNTSDKSVDSERVKKIVKKALIGAGAVALTAAAVYTASEIGIDRTFSDISIFKDTLVKAARSVDVKNRRLLTDAELNKKIARLELEQKLKNLTDADVRPGTIYLKNLGKSVGTKALSTITTGALLYGAKSLVSGEFNRREAGNAVFKGGAGKK